MPKRRKSYVLTETAERDFREARRWSRKRWGEQQTRTYFERLHEGAECIARHQNAAAQRDDLIAGSELGIYPIGEHYMVYLPIDDRRIAIVALIRQTRDVPAILESHGFQIRRQLKAIFDEK